MFVRLSLLVFIVSLLGACAEPEVTQEVAEKQTAADLILHNANIYTLDWPEPDTNGNPDPAAPFDNNQWSSDASVVVVQDGKILAVGGKELVTEYQTDTTQLVDLNGATLLPGFIDSHTHLVELGKLLHVVNLANVQTPEEAIERIKAFAVDIPEGEWIVGRGWDEGAWASNYPTMDELSERVPNHPVLLDGLHSYAVWGNRMAFELAIERIDTFAGVMTHEQDPTVAVAVRHRLVGRPPIERVVRDELHVQRLGFRLRVSHLVTSGQ